MPQRKSIECAAALVRRFKVRNTNLLRTKMFRLSYQRPMDSKFTGPKPLVIPWLGATLEASLLEASSKVEDDRRTTGNAADDVGQPASVTLKIQI